MCTVANRILCLSIHILIGTMKGPTKVKMGLKWLVFLKINAKSHSCVMSDLLCNLLLT